MDQGDIISLKDVRFRWPGPSSFGISVPEMSLRAGETVLLLGESGSGKSTIGRMLVGLLSPTAGHVEIEGVDLAAETDPDKVLSVRSNIQMIFQDRFASLNPRWRVRDIIVEPVVEKGGDSEGLA